MAMTVYEREIGHASTGLQNSPFFSSQRAVQIKKAQIHATNEAPKRAYSRASLKLGVSIPNPTLCRGGGLIWPPPLNSKNIKAMTTKLGGHK